MFVGFYMFATNLLNIFVGNPESERIWNQYKVDFKKSYDSHQEKIRREIFLDNLKAMISHNLKYESGMLSFMMGLNELSDMTFAEFQKINSPPPIPISHMMFLDQEYLQYDFNASFKAPSTFDWRKYNMVTSVKNQGQLCGSCYAFAAISAAESYLLRKTKKHYDLSEQEIIDCAEKYETNGCNGGFEYGAIQYIKEQGEISDEKSYPYKNRKGDCKLNNRTKVPIKIKRISSANHNNEEIMKQALIIHGPLLISFDHNHESFMRYSSGIYYEPNCSKYKTHSALLVGYSEDYWIVKNSFGRRWGENGYLRITRQKKNHCAICDEFFILE